ncbi:substrate-binding domain-containing protein, partial [Candidatus Dependentiae bacterium]|nr:substrate-binding domain-containing protein [Candidatus Dependentiae bacterium]
VVKDAVVPTMNAKNPHAALLLQRGVTGRECEKIWIKKEIVQWDQLLKTGDSSPIRVYTRSDACGAAETWARYMHGSQEDLQGVGVFGDPGLAEAVRNDTLGIGYNNINFAYDAKTKKPVAGLIILPLDLNANGRIDTKESFYETRDCIMKAIADSIYPSPPARDLHLVSKGKPAKKAVVTFLRWIMNEGRKYVPEAGYIDFSVDKLRKEKRKLQ